MVRELDGVDRHRIVAEALERKYGRTIADITEGDVGLDREYLFHGDINGATTGCRLQQTCGEVRYALKPAPDRERGPEPRGCGPQPWLHRAHGRPVPAAARSGRPPGCIPRRRC